MSAELCLAGLVLTHCAAGQADQGHGDAAVDESQEVVQLTLDGRHQLTVVEGPQEASPAVRVEVEPLGVRPVPGLGDKKAATRETLPTDTCTGQSASCSSACYLLSPSIVPR